jgi:hypothetical protein
VACFNGADRPETEEYRRVDSESELAAAIKACGGEPLIDAYAQFGMAAEVRNQASAEMMN